MRQGSLLVNASRIAIIDTDALLTGLDQRRPGMCAPEVFDEEPLAADSIWRTHERVVATPHLGYVTARNYGTWFPQAVENIAAFLAGSPVRRLNFI